MTPSNFLKASVLLFLVLAGLVNGSAARSVHAAAVTKLYVADYGTNSVSIVDTSTSPATINSVSVGSRPFGIAANLDGSRVYVANYGDGTLSIIDTTVWPNQVIASPYVGPSPVAVTYDPNRNRVYVALKDGNAVAIVDANSNTQIGYAVSMASTYSSALAFPLGVAVSPNGNWVYVTNAGFAGGLTGNGLYYFSAAAPPQPPNHANAAPALVGSGPLGIVVDPTGNYLYVANSNDGTVSYAYLPTCCDPLTPVPTIRVGAGPVNLAMSPDGSRLYVTNLSGNSVSIINTSTESVTGTLSVGTAPTGITVSSDGSRVYVANANSNSISAIDTTASPASVVNTINLPSGSSPKDIVAVNSVGTTGSPVASLSTTHLDLGSVPVGSTSSPQTITLTNTGNAPLTISNMIRSGPNWSDFTDLQNCIGKTLSPGGTCTDTMKFTPGATGTRNATLTYYDNAADSPQTVTLTGMGTSSGGGGTTITLQAGAGWNMVGGSPLTLWSDSQIN